MSRIETEVETRHIPEIASESDLQRARRFSIAPMMDWTDRHCRAFHRVLTREALLYTEMVTTGAIIHGPRDRLLRFDAVEHPVAVQLGGSDPDELAAAARICADVGYDEVNLNVGCPSDRVQNGRFGACLMREPELVGRCVAAMVAAVSLPVTVKCRIGVDDQDPQAALGALIAEVSTAGAAFVTVHARKAWLQGLSPKENRDVPPLDYALVHAARRAWPALPMGINGGIVSLDAALRELTQMDGVMMGRAAYHTPDLLIGVDQRIFGAAEPAVADGFEAIERFKPYMAARLGEGVRLHDMTRHLLGLFAGLPGARAWRRHLAVEGPKPGAGLDVVDRALSFVRERAEAPDRAA